MKNSWIHDLTSHLRLEEALYHHIVSVFLSLRHQQATKYSRFRDYFQTLTFFLIFVLKASTLSHSQAENGILSAILRHSQGLSTSGSINRCRMNSSASSSTNSLAQHTLFIEQLPGPKHLYRKTQVIYQVIKPLTWWCSHSFII